LKGWPAAAEDLMVARNVELSRLTGARVHIAHISTAGSVELVRRAKGAGLPVTAEATPHHLTLTDERVMGPGRGLVGLAMEKDAGSGPPYDTAAKVNPPLRTQADVEAVTAGLLDGTIDCIATDHAPHAAEDKLCEFDLAANGISGFETALGACMSLVHRGIIDISTLLAKLTSEPARLLRGSLVPDGLGTLGIGAPADVVLIDPNASWTVIPARFLSKGRNTPYAGVVMTGRVVATFYGGTMVYGETR